MLKDCFFIPACHADEGSTQVLTEPCNTMTRKLKFDFSIALKTMNECCANNILVTNTKDIIEEATKIADRYGFSFYDSLIISAALNAGCKTFSTFAEI